MMAERGHFATTILFLDARAMPRQRIFAEPAERGIATLAGVYWLLAADGRDDTRHC